MCNVTVIEVFAIWVSFFRRRLEAIVLSVGVFVLAKAVSCNYGFIVTRLSHTHAHTKAWG